MFGFISFAAQADDLAAVTAALDSAGTLAEVAGHLNSGAYPGATAFAYLFDGRERKPRWLVTDDGVYCTKYFLDNMPDPKPSGTAVAVGDPDRAARVTIAE